MHLIKISRKEEAETYWRWAGQRAGGSSGWIVQDSVCIECQRELLALLQSEKITGSISNIIQKGKTRKLYS